MTATPSTLRTRSLWVGSLLAIPTLALLLWFSLGGRSSALAPSTQPPVLNEVPPFQLTNAQGKTVRNSDFKGLWIADFIFTKCDRQCPMLTGKMKALAAKLPGVELVSFSVDSSDTPEVLRRYKRFNRAGWIFLTGKGDEVLNLAVKGFKLAAAKGKKEFTHSRSLVLIDQKGLIRGYFDSSSEEEMSELVHLVRSLVGLS